MKKLLIAAFVLFAATAVPAQEQTADAPLVIKAQGSFLAGGTVVKAAGAYETKHRLGEGPLARATGNGQTVRGLH